MNLFTDPAPKSAGPTLPVARLPRFQPLRAGILNVWEYDEQEFWFQGGRLILRGGNEAGKSKALELLMPLLLDADLRPSRLDPFGERAKTMSWNLIDFDPDRNTAIGYVWMEFGRVCEDGQSSYVTLGAGMRGSRGTGHVIPWFWIARGRVGQDFRLHENSIPLTREGLRESLGANGELFEAARDYRAAVDQALFHLGSERYASLVNLLLQLRRPQLSAKLDPKELAAVLSASLPPLDEGKIGQLAEAFDRLDADVEGLARIGTAQRALTAFRSVYAAYAKQQGRRHAHAVRSSVTRLDKVTRVVRAARDTLEKAGVEASRIDGDLTDSTRELEAQRGALDGLDRSAAKKSADQLLDLQGRVEAEKSAANQARIALENASSDTQRGARDVATAEEEDRSAQEVAQRHTRGAAEAASEADLTSEHEAHAREMQIAPDRARLALDAVGARRIEVARKLIGLRGLTRDAERQQVDAMRAESEAQKRLEREQTRAKEADAALARAGEAFESATLEWAKGAGSVVVAPEQRGDVALNFRERVEGGEPARAIIEDAVLAPRTALETRRGELVAERTRLTTTRGELLRRRESIAAEHEDGPPPRVGRSPNREPSRGDPLWKLCDFAEHVNATERAALEAALDASGLLDALVTPKGEIVPQVDDVMVCAVGPPTANMTLRDVLTPVPSVEVSQEVIRRALGAVAVIDVGDEPSGIDAWVCLDGRWRLGALWGQWSKHAAEHVGAGARAAARVRRLAAIDAEIATLEAQIARTDSSLDDVAARKDALRAAVKSFPDGRDVVRALADRRAIANTLATAANDVQAAKREVELASRRLEEARRRLQGAAEKAGLLAFLDDLEGLIERIHEYRRAVGELAAKSQSALASEKRLASQRDRFQELTQRAETARGRAEGADRLAARSAAELATLRESVGATVDEVLRRRGDLVAQIKALDERLVELRKELQEVKSKQAVAQRDLDAAEDERRQREEERTGAVSGLTRFGLSELLELVLDRSVIPPTPWNVTVALELARDVETATSDVEYEGQALDRGETQVHDAFRTLQKDLGGDYDPAGSREDGLFLVLVRHDGRMRRIGELEAILATETAKRQELLGQHERELIERHLLGEVGHHLQSRMVDARTLVVGMNRQLERHPTNSGITVRLKWLPSADADERTQAALRVLERDVRLLKDSDRNALVRFLRERIAEARSQEGGAGSADRMARALDYRAWHDFSVFVCQDARETKLTSRTYATGSGGSKAVLVHLPLFAAAAAHYGSARTNAPRLILLDEAFAGIDAQQRGSCMGLLVAFDLDFFITNHDEWGCYAELPEVATYHLERHPPQRGVAAMRFVWNGQERVEDDPYLVARTPELPL